MSGSRYRAQGTWRGKSLARDPANRLLARGPRFRLDAEMLRDQAFYLGGLLVERVGGPSVKPPQPSGLWEAVGYTDSNTARFTADSGVGKVHRRSLYTFWKRTSPPPQMTTLDAPSREACQVRRERTNTPLQALLLLNEAGRARPPPRLCTTGSGPRASCPASTREWPFARRETPCSSCPIPREWTAPRAGARWTRSTASTTASTSRLPTRRLRPGSPSQGALTRDNYGRDHHPKCFPVWFAGGGIKKGVVYGGTDDFCYNVVENPVHIHDLNATILHCLGIDHRRLSFKFQGLDMRLTGVEEHSPVKGILA